MGNSWQARDALKLSASSIPKIVSPKTYPKGDDPFGQVVWGELVLHTRFGKIEQLPPIYSPEHEFHDETPKSITSPFQELVYTNMRVVKSMIYEWYQKHQTCANQEYGAVELVRWDKAPGSLVPGIDLLLVESTGNKEGECRRISQLGLRKERVPDEEAVGADAFRAFVWRMMRMMKSSRRSGRKGLSRSFKG
ncbi:uncharacterized protein PAC_12968 [Phialocephala subalpina]|uniref:Uncharacterized protein n=1 Tax=Phialocephala subalpina TaxID=576137 RepID=A0A1L7XDH3_9HELO|nr:uncharacterized protein PAC_12968 [Phialocephala subalpina]